MENAISNEYIDNAINELEKFIGIKEPVNCKNIYSLVWKSKHKDAMKLIARQIGLPIDINIISVSDDYRFQSGGNQFFNSQLGKVQRNKFDNESIAAQVIIPNNLPFYGSQALNGFPINFIIRKGTSLSPEILTMLMAHELSHILLYSLNYQKKENEIYTDLTAIMLGFMNIFRAGRKIQCSDIKQNFNSTITTTEITTYGYLNDNQFNFALKKINLLLVKNRKRKNLLSGQLQIHTNLLRKYEKAQIKFKIFLEYLTKNTDKKISGKDGQRMVTFFQPGFMNDYLLSVKEYKKKKEIIKIFFNGFTHYTNQGIIQLSTYTNTLKTYNTKIKAHIIPLKNDVKMLKKYVGYKYRIKIFFSLLFKKNKK